MLHKKAQCFILILALFLSNFIFSAHAVSASSAIVMVAQTGEVLYEQNARESRSMASTTKIMTAILAIESERLSEKVTVSDKMILGVEGTSMGLRKGDVLTLENIVKGMMLLSGNDAAKAVAVFLSASEEGFAELMNKKAKEIGMKHTNFVTASGLDDENHYSTAYDMALLASYAIQNPSFKEIVSQYYDKVEYISPESAYTYRNHNRFLQMYEGACGIKTGFTKKSGRCLVTAVDKDGYTVVAVTLKAPDDWNDHKWLYNTCLPMVKTQEFDDKFKTKINVVGGEKDSIFAEISKEVTLTYTKKNPITSAVYVEKFEYAPIKKGDIVGIVKFYSGNVCVKEAELLALEDVDFKEVEDKKPSIIDYIKNFFQEIKNG